MADQVAELLQTLRAYRLPGIDLGVDVQHPYYDGYSILNVPSTICRLLGVPELGAPALSIPLDQVLGDGIRRVVLVLMDALALHRLQRWLAESVAPVWAELAQNGFLVPLTSIIPSTTSAALTTLWTGRSPYEHGIMGYEMWLKEYGIIANMILHTPASFDSSPGSLTRAGFDPPTYLPFPTLGTHLQAHGGLTHAFLHYTIARSGLSQMFLKDAKVHAFGTAADLWIGVRQLLETHQRGPLYTWVYWGDVDHLSHHHGPDDERPQAEFASFSTAFERLFLERLPSQARQGTVVILLADHGMLATAKVAHYELHKHPSLMRRLHMSPTGENRLMYLYVRPGQTEAVREYIERTWLGSFRVLDAVYAVESGLFGSGDAHPRLLERVGDLVVYPGASGYLWWVDKENPLLGRHGGLHPDEMLVPLLVARLG
jgi:hypothetical protein